MVQKSSRPGGRVSTAFVVGHGYHRARQFGPNTMKIAVLKERRSGEYRVAATPETVKKYKALGLDVVVESGAGEGAYIADSAYEAEGATITPDAASTVEDAVLVLKVQRPMAEGEGEDEIGYLPEGSLLIANLQALTNPGLVAALAEAKVTSFAMELMPRITRAQAMDVLSSQSNLAGYKAVIDAAAAFSQAMPMMMTAAGTVAPARVLVFGAGVAGLQAIATAKRLGAVVLATDVRYAAKEQVESLGGRFIVVDEESMKAAETEAGYAKEMGEEFKKKQAQAVREEVTKADIVITTALIPGKPAPRLVTAEMIRDMKAGSVIVDLAAEAGGNVEGSELDKAVNKNGVLIMGYANLASRLARDSSSLYARNLYNFIATMVDKDSGALAVDWDDELIAGTLVTKAGQAVHTALGGGG